MLLVIHSALRYLVLLVGLLVTAYAAYGLSTKQPAGKPMRVLGAIFTGLVDLQVLIGLGVALMGPFVPKDIGHVVMMVAAAAVAHVCLAKNRRLPQPGFKLPLIGVGGALVLIVGGILAIRPGLFSGVLMGG